MLTIKHLGITYQRNTPIIEDFNLSLNSGDILAMLGDSGSGKTSILKSIAGLITIQTGYIALDNRVLNDKKQHIPPENRNVGMVFQDYALFPHLTIEKNIAFGLGHLHKKQQKSRIIQLLDLVDLPNVESYYPHQLSGGQQQRVALVRSLANKPKVLLLDEPFSNLDSSHKQPLIKQMRSILKQENMTAIFVTHNEDEAKKLADKTFVLN